MKKVIIFVAAIVALWAVFVGGRKSGYEEAARIKDLGTQSINALNAMGGYAVLSDVTREIIDKKDSKALCTVQVYASAKVIEVRKCLDEPQCRSLIEAEVQKAAPELLGNGSLKIKFFPIGEKCVP